MSTQCLHNLGEIMCFLKQSRILLKPFRGLYRVTNGEIPGILAHTAPGGSRLPGQQAALAKGAGPGLPVPAPQDTLPCPPPLAPAGISARWCPADTLHTPGRASRVRPLGVGSLGQGIGVGPGFLTCSPGPQKGALGPVGKAGRNLYMAGVGGLVLCADRVLSGEDGPQSG